MIDLEVFDESNVKIEYKVNKEKRTVVSIITTINDFSNRLAKYNLADENYDDNIDIRIYKGIAKCAPEDEWDESYGKHLAEYRAAKARQIDINTELKKYINGIINCVDNLYEYGLLKEPHKPKEKG